MLAVANAMRIRVPGIWALIRSARSMIARKLEADRGRKRIKFRKMGGDGSRLTDEIAGALGDDNPTKMAEVFIDEN
jgi:hypothetical protein